MEHEPLLIPDYSDDKDPEQWVKSIGKSAFERGDKVDSCPFALGDDRRRDWLDGYYEGRADAAIRRTLEKNGLRSEFRR